MIRTVTEDRRYCDVPGCEEMAFRACLRCGRDTCWEHRETDSTDYAAKMHLYYSLIRDGWYCHPCDAALCELDGTPEQDELHAAYRALAALQADGKAQFAAFEVVRKAAEARIAAVLAAKEVK